MDRDDLLVEYANQLVAWGDMASFEEVFGTDDPDYDLDNLSTDELQEIYDEYVEDN